MLTKKLNTFDVLALFFKYLNNMLRIVQFMRRIINKIIKKIVQSHQLDTVQTLKTILVGISNNP